MIKHNPNDTFILEQFELVLVITAASKDLKLWSWLHFIVFFFNVKKQKPKTDLEKCY